MWSADGRKVMVRTSLGLTMHDADGSGHSEVIPGTSEFDYPAQMTADGATLVFLRSGQETSFDIMTMPLGNPRQIRALVKTSAYEGGARLSPDGKWLSYVSNESGQNEIYVRPFGGPDRRWQISSQGGTQALWNPNGREIFYRDGNKMMAVDVTAAGDDLKLSPAHLLFEQRYAFGSGITIANYDVSRDGQKFLMVKDEAGAGRLSVVLNAFADLPR
jgi:Tol biopolymer transport system component